MEALAIQSFFSLVLGRPVVLRCLEDNTTCIRNVDKGYSQAQRHLPRTQRTSLGFLHEVFCENQDEATIGATVLQHAPTKEHKGDFFTKDSHTQADFEKALLNLRIVKSFDDFQRGERKPCDIKPQITPKQAAELLSSKIGMPKEGGEEA